MISLLEERTYPMSITRKVMIFIPLRKMRMVATGWGKVVKSMIEIHYVLFSRSVHLNPPNLSIHSYTHIFIAQLGQHLIASWRSVQTDGLFTVLWDLLTLAFVKFVLTSLKASDSWHFLQALEHVGGMQKSALAVMINRILFQRRATSLSFDQIVCFPVSWTALC